MKSMTRFRSGSAIVRAIRRASASSRRQCWASRCSSGESGDIDLLRPSHPGGERRSADCVPNKAIEDIFPLSYRADPVIRRTTASGAGRTEPERWRSRGAHTHRFPVPVRWREPALPRPRRRPVAGRVRRKSGQQLRFAGGAFGSPSCMRSSLADATPPFPKRSTGIGARGVRREQRHLPGPRQLPSTCLARCVG